MRSLLFVTDAWRPQINGVVRTLEATIEDLRRRGMRCEVIAPNTFSTLPCPTYPEIRLSLTTSARLASLIVDAHCDHIHLATEGPLGLASAKALHRMGRTWTTSYHTRFPEYVAARLPVPVGWSYALLRRFHNQAGACMIATQTLASSLTEYGFDNLALWPRGVDTQLFTPERSDLDPFTSLPRPIWLNVGRVAVEKNLPAFLDLDLPGSKVVVGDGPQLEALRCSYPTVHFSGAKSGPELAQFYVSADAFVFPSLTDTFGLVLLEAMACGLPIAAFPVMGPADVVANGRTGVLSEDLRAAALSSLELSRKECRAHALEYTWEKCTDAFLRIAEQAEERHEGCC